MQTKNDVLTALDTVIAQRKQTGGDASYVAQLMARGVTGMSDKVTEEAQEICAAAASGDVNQVIYETADLWFHNLVLLSYLDCNHDDVLKELDRRFGVSGIVEKSSR